MLTTDTNYQLEVVWVTKWHFRGDREFKPTAEFGGFSSEVFVDVHEGVKIRTPGFAEQRYEKGLFR